MDQSTVLIISDDADFSRAVMDRWQGERNAPAFTLMSGDICRDLDADGFDMAVVGPVRPDILPAVFKALEPAGNPVVFVGDGKQVLGNSKLLLLEPGSLSVASRSQIETIRNMAVRMHEILQRFSSIEKELNAVEQQAENEARSRIRVAAATS